MAHALISFDRSGLDDEYPSRTDSDDGRGGRKCLLWMSQALATFPNDGVDKEPVAEDWGWVIGVKCGPDGLMLGCSEVGGAEPQWCAQIANFGGGGLLPGVRKRRAEAVDKLASHIYAFLKAQPDVSNLRREAGRG